MIQIEDHARLILLIFLNPVNPPFALSSPILFFSSPNLFAPVKEEKDWRGLFCRFFS